MMRNPAGRLNWTMLTCVFLLCSMGLLALWTFSTPDWSDPGVMRTPVVRQAIFMLVSIVVLGITLLPNPFHAKRFAWFVFAVCIVALVALLFFGRVTRGAKGWFMIGPIGLQPAEFTKIATVLVLARVLMYARNLHKWWGLLLPLGIVALPARLIFLQPDFGSAILFGPAALAMLFAAGARVKHLLLLALLAGALGAGAFQFGMKPYQQKRLFSFVTPEKVSKWDRYQQDQSIKSCGSGGITGRGLGEPTPSTSFHIPDRHNDFVFSILAEELGFVGSLFLLLLFGILFYQSLRMAFLTRHPFARLVIVGLTSIFAMQFFINIGMTIGVAPITGLSLPFISYGGSSLLTSMISLGLILNLGGRWSPNFSSDVGDGSVHMNSFTPHRNLREVL